MCKTETAYFRFVDGTEISSIHPNTLFCFYNALFMLYNKNKIKKWRIYRFAYKITQFRNAHFGTDDFVTKEGQNKNLSMDDKLKADISKIVDDAVLSCVH